jgi:hypothetical protein
MVGPTIARPGSIEICGTAKFEAAHAALTVFAKAGIISDGLTVTSPGK